MSVNVYSNNELVRLTGGPNDASKIKYSNTTSGLSAADVESAIDELASEKIDTSHIVTTLETCTASTSDEDIVNTAVIKELQSNFQAGVDTIYNAIVKKGAAPANHTPSSLAVAIDSLSASKPTSNIQVTFTSNSAGTAFVGNFILYVDDTQVSSKSVSIQGTGSMSSDTYTLQLDDNHTFQAILSSTTSATVISGYLTLYIDGVAVKTGTSSVKSGSGSLYSISCDFAPNVSSNSNLYNFYFDDTTKYPHASNTYITYIGDGWSDTTYPNNSDASVNYFGGFTGKYTIQKAGTLSIFASAGEGEITVSLNGTKILDVYAKSSSVTKEVSVGDVIQLGPSTANLSGHSQHWTVIGLYQ